MLGRTLLVAICAAVVAVAIGQSAPHWLASVTTGSEVAPAAAPERERAEPPPAGRQVTLRAGPEGHVVVEGTVNNRTVTFLVDTGATMVVLNEATARRLGIHPSPAEYTQASRTANGAVLVAPVRLAEIRIAGIAVRDVPAVVVPGGVLDTNLLGMSFLSRLRRFEFGGDRLILTD